LITPSATREISTSIQKRRFGIARCGVLKVVHLGLGYGLRVFLSVNTALVFTVYLHVFTALDLQLHVFRNPVCGFGYPKPPEGVL
jgi:hypothetical protein